MLCGMLVKFLSRIPEFKNATNAELEGLVRASAVLCIPKGRWVVQKDRDLGAYLYLLRGAIETRGPNATLKSGRLRKHVYPGCASVRTKTVCQLLRVDADHRDLIVARSLGFSPEVRGQWLSRFLESKMMKGLSKPEWQKLLGASRQVTIHAGQKVLNLGEDSRDCYVVESGRARVHRGDKALRDVGPGDFFGEDAVLANAPRNATVTALEPMVLHAIDGLVFYEVVVPRLVKTVTKAVGGVRLNLGERQESGAIPMDPLTIRERAGSFDPRERYFLVGGGWHTRTLCAFLLAQRGLQSYVVAS